MLAKVKIEGSADVKLNNIVCRCAFCDNHDEADARLELNFKDMKFYYLCSKCKKQNIISFGDSLPPMPRTRMGK